MDQFLYLETIGRKSSKKHRIEIWFVEGNRKYYIMSKGIERAHWVQNILHNPNVSWSAAGGSFSGFAKIIEKGPLVAQIKNLMKQKYGWDEGLIVELASYTIPAPSCSAPSMFVVPRFLSGSE